MYVGCNLKAEKPAQDDDALRKKRQEAVRLYCAQLEQRLRLEAEVEQLHELAIDWAALLMALAGYHQHDRGEWRKRRERPLATKQSKNSDG